MNSTKYTFWSLLNEHTIEVPIIQRDYAQGRANEKVDDRSNVSFFALNTVSSSLLFTIGSNSSSCFSSF